LPIYLVQYSSIDFVVFSNPVLDIVSPPYLTKIKTLFRERKELMGSYKLPDTNNITPFLWHFISFFVSFLYPILYPFCFLLRKVIDKNFGQGHSRKKVKLSVMQSITILDLEVQRLLIYYRINKLL